MTESKTDSTPGGESIAMSATTDDEALLSLLAGEAGESADAQSTDDAPDADTTDDTPEADGDESGVFTIKADGREFRFTGTPEEKAALEERIADGLRARDYTQKTQTLAEQRRALEQERQTLTQDRERAKRVLDTYTPRLDKLEEAIKAFSPTEPEPNLRKSDPEEYTRQLAEYQAHQRHLENLARQREETLKEAQADQERQVAAAVKRERDRLQEIMPSLRDPKTFETKSQEWTAFGRSLGFSDDELGQIYDHRAIQILDMAMRMYNLEQKHAQLKSTKTTTLKPGAKPPERTGATKKRFDKNKETFLKDPSHVNFDRAVLAFLEETEK